MRFDWKFFRVLYFQKIDTTESFIVLIFHYKKLALLSSFRDTPSPDPKMEKTSNIW